MNTTGLSATQRTGRGGADLVPFLPGNACHEAKDAGRQRNNKSQSLNYGQGGNGGPRTESLLKGAEGMTSGNMWEVPKLDLAMLKAITNPHNRYNHTNRSLTHEERDTLKESARNSFRPAISPAWLKHDRQVLRFYAYFQEPVYENPKENFRVRNCIILFYLEDGTMMVVEPKVENSGIPQGTFVKRHRIPRTPPKTGYYTYHDLKCGISLGIYARVFRITGCDEFTKTFFETALGTDIGEKESVPLDSFRQTQIDDGVWKAMPLSRDIQESKEYVEMALGGNRRNAKLQQYLENDRKVLSFKAYWDDPTRYGSRMYYTLHYYLADDTVEMLDCLARNSGRDPYPVFWRRAPLRKNPFVCPAPGMSEPEPIIYRPEDFKVGATVMCYGREITLYDCDEFTRNFYIEYMGYDQGSIEMKPVVQTHVKLSHPPHTGFGTEEDSLASCLHLTPRLPWRDINKLMNDADKVMRFQARMLDNNPENESRRFVIGICLADDGVGVWETKQRNSGHTEGKFASKSRKKNPATGTWFAQKDFYIGAIVEINSVRFRILAADEGTLRYMEEHYTDFVVADAGLVAYKLRDIEDVLKAHSETQITVEQMQRIIESSGSVVDLCEHEYTTLIRAFSESGDRIDLPMLLDTIGFYRQHQDVA